MTTPLSTLETEKAQMYYDIASPLKLPTYLGEGCDNPRQSFAKHVEIDILYNQSDSVASSIRIKDDGNGFTLESLIDL